MPHLAVRRIPTGAGIHPYSLQYSPFHPNRIACAAATHFGLVGNGQLLVIPDTASAGGPQPPPPRIYETQDAVFDCAWSEIHESHVVAACGDGGIRLFDLAVDSPHPVRRWQAAAEREAMSVSWNLVAKDSFASASWDGCVAVWSPEVSEAPVRRYPGAHAGCIYEVASSPRDANIIASAAADQCIRIWDTRAGAAAIEFTGPPGTEFLSLDFHKYHPDMVVAGSTDHLVTTIDLRNPRIPHLTLPGHTYAVRRVRCSPHDPDLIASASYDMTARIWSLSTASQLGVWDGHTEFVVGLDWSLWTSGELATCAWDQQVHLIDVPMLIRQTG